MPIYVYECPACGYRYERIEHYSSSGEPPDCPRCAIPNAPDVLMRRVISAGVPVFKGKGWTRPSGWKEEER